MLKYKLVKLKDGTIVCISPCFTSDNVEFVPAWEIFDKYGYDKNGSYMEQYVLHCAEEGTDPSCIRNFLDYQAMTDFLIQTRTGIWQISVC